MKQNVQDPLSLFFDRGATFRKIVGKHGAIEQVSQYVEQLVDRNHTNLSFVDIVLINGPQSFAIALRDVRYR